MASSPNKNLSSGIRRLLVTLRRRIRTYVLLEGLAVAVIWCGLTFWAGLALDYLPVLAGASEMPRVARMVLLICVGLVLAYILLQRVIRRVFVSLADRSLALLIERQFPAFVGSLITSVEMAHEHNNDSVTPELLSQTRQWANDSLGEVRLSRVFRWVPLVRSLVGAGLAVASLALFALLARQAFATSIKRLYLLSDQSWPRRSHIELVGFDANRIKVARGSDMTVRVRADANRPTPAPDVCTIHYTTADGNRGRVNMSKDGAPHQGYQHYVFTGRPFKDILSAVQFDVVGFDHRLRDCQVLVVDSPTIISLMVEAQPPQYTGLLSRKERWHPGLRLPYGSKVRLQVTCNKSLSSAVIRDLEYETELALAINTEPTTANEVVHNLGILVRDQQFEFELDDKEGISSQEPLRFIIGVIEDLAPRVKVGLHGIGTAITPDARIPLEGEVSDDYGIDETWFEISVQQGASLTHTLRPASESLEDVSLDLRRRRAEDVAWSLAAGQHIAFSVKAQDTFDLADGPHIGQSDRFDLDIVHPDQLLAQLEARELYLRRRFEQTISEFTHTRDSLARLRTATDNMNSSADDADQISAKPTATENLRDSERSLRILRIQRGIQESERAAVETDSVSASFQDIRHQMTNNRIDTDEHNSRLQEQIILPLNRIVSEQFPHLSELLAKLESQARVEGERDVQPAVVATLAQVEQILLELEKVLEKMLQLESYNELVAIVRSMIEDQKKIIESTRKERKRRALELLEN